MQGKKVYLLLSILVLIFVGALIFLLFFNSSGPSEDVINQALKTEDEKSNAQEIIADIPPESIESFDGDFLRMAHETGDASKCLGFSDDSYVITCVTEIGRRTQDDGVCSLIKDSGEMAKCVDMVKFSKGLKSELLNDCSAISDNDLAMSCIVNLIDAKGFSADACLSLPEREKVFCQGHISYLNDVAAAKSATKESDCQAINIESAKAYCLDKFPSN